MGSGGHGHKGVKGGVLFAALLLSAFFSSALSHRLHKGDKLGHLVPTKVGEAASHSSSSSSTTTTASPYVHYPNLDPNNDSKRRVPNGPDPIHNRRAGKSRQPPGRA